jgi:hypothetical protein
MVETLDSPPKIGYILGMQNSTATAPVAPNTATKSVLARLLATENIHVEHSDVPTAAFDLKTRTLILPRWKDMSNALYDMLVGHEVSHALNTPQTGWSNDSKTLAAKHGVGEAVARQYLNIAEDARIERLIKTKFPGLRADFFKGYGELHAKNFFDTNGQAWSDMCLGDRVNLHFKLGLHTGACITFTASEQTVVDALDAAVSWEDAVAAADAMLAVDAAKWQKQQETEQSENGNPMPTDGEGEGASQPQQSSDAATGEGETKQQSGNTQRDGGEKSAPSAGSNPDSQGGSGAGDAANASSSGADRKPQNNMPAPRTQSAFDNAMKTLNENKKRGGYDVVRIGLCEPQDVVVDFKTVLADAESIVTRNRLTIEPFRSSEYKTASSAMATAFDRRKAADTWKRTVIAKTGNIDPLRMTQYRWNEDIFRRTARVTTGKNHGIVILLDWSGSMHPIMQQTLGQLLILTDFCRMAGVPFEVFAFSDSPYATLPNGVDPYSNEAWELYNKQSKEWNDKMSGKAGTAHVSLLNFFSSRMTAAQYERMKGIMWKSWGYVANDRRYRMSSTPTVAALYHLCPVVERFLKTNGVQIAHTVVLTDGEATDGFYPNVKYAGNAYGNHHHVVEDAVTGASYDIEHHYESDGVTSKPFQRGSVRWDIRSCNASVCAAIDILRRRTGSKVHWIGLTERAGTTIPSMGDFVADTKGNNWSRDGYARGRAGSFDTAVIAAAARFGGAGNDSWLNKQLDKMDEKIDSAKTARTLVTAVVNKQAMANSMRSLATLIGEYLALA